MRICHKFQKKNYLYSKKNRKQKLVLRKNRNTTCRKVYSLLVEKITLVFNVCLAIQVTLVGVDRAEG